MELFAFYKSNNLRIVCLLSCVCVTEGGGGGEGESEREREIINRLLLASITAFIVFNLRDVNFVGFSLTFIMKFSIVLVSPF